MSRAQHTTEALNDLQHLFSAEDQEGLIGVFLEYFTTPTVSFQDEHSDEISLRVCTASQLVRCSIGQALKEHT